MKISLVVSDVDATLITPEHTITPRAVLAIHELQRRGIGFTLASSRPPRGLQGFAEKLGLTEPFAAFNGGVIQRRTGETLVKHTLSREVCEAAFEITEQFEIGLWLYCDHDWHVDKISPFVEREQKTIGFNATLEQNLKDTFGMASKLVMVGDPSLIVLAERVALARFGTEVSATKSKPRFLDITAKEAHKGTVVTELAALLGIPTAEVAVIGDGLNDILMFERAGFSIAMGQAADEVKSAATVMTRSNTDEGFAAGIEKYILQNEQTA
jgi:Cof subfamily protein (haloacid dehalogenase superfamily)